MSCSIFACGSPCSSSFKEDSPDSKQHFRQGSLAGVQLKRGCIGYCAGLPSAIGAKMVRQDHTVIAVVGDGGFMMNSQVGSFSNPFSWHCVLCSPVVPM